ncbi:hypothetical protein F5X96DRAFT_613472, partial [Biscogniauxia mediterranea]
MEANFESFASIVNAGRERGQDFSLKKKAVIVSAHFAGKSLRSLTTSFKTFKSVITNIISQ